MAKIKVPTNIRRVHKQIEEIWNKLSSSKRHTFSPQEINAIEETIGYLDRGHLRVAAKVDGNWTVNEWLKKAILLYFRVRNVEPIKYAGFSFVDKIPIKKWTGDEGVRVVPPAVVRYGAYLAPQCVAMPSYVNIGAYVGEGTMVDTWATVGSCAQIGAHVHLSGGVGIGGVLEPLQAQPVIIEDHCFIGSRCVVVEGVVVEEGAVLGAGVVLTSSTKIIDVTQKEPFAMRGRVPRNAVVIPGMTKKSFPGGSFGVPCALIIGTRNANTDRKTSLNQALRDYF